MLTLIQKLLGLNDPAPRPAPVPLAAIPRPTPPERRLPARGGPGPAQDLIGLVGFNDAAFAIVEPTHAFDARLQQAAAALPARTTGGTHLVAGLHAGVQMLAARPCNHRGRLWLLTDGYPTTGQDQLQATLAAARCIRANINTIGFGDTYDEQLLRSIAAATHNGRFVPVTSLRQLTDALVSRPPKTQAQFTPETTVLALDLSGSMDQPMDGKSKITIVQEALIRLLLIKQRLFSRR